MIKQSVKKPYTVLVAVIMVIALGVVSLVNMTADLLPNISLPYLIVVTTYPGASPEKVEADVSIPIEEALGTVNGVKTVSSTSAENYSMVQLEFEDDTDMDSALVKVFSALDPVEATLPDDVGTPSIIEVSADMLATAYVGFEYDGKDIYELTSFAKDEIVPAVERVDGVASVTNIGLVEQTIHIQLNEEKVTALNDKILAKTNRAFAKALGKLNDAKEQLDDAQQQIDDARADLPDQWREYYDGVEEYEDNVKDLAKSKREIEDNIDDLEEAQAQIAQAADMSGQFYKIDSGLAVAGITSITEIPAKITEAKEGIAYLKESIAAETDPDVKAELEAQLATVEAGLTGLNSTVSGLNQIISAYNMLRESANLKKVKWTATTLTDEQWYTIKSSWSGLWANANASLTSALSLLEMAKEQIESGESQLDAAQEQLDKAREALEDVPGQLDDSQEQLDDSWESYYDSLDTYYKQRAVALKSANADELLQLSTLAQLIYAQNFEMPAGYIDDENDNSWLLKVGENISSLEDLKNTVLTHIDEIGDISVIDVADVTVIDNSEDSYAKINGEQAILLAVYKGSTASTKEVGDSVVEAAKELETKFEGLHSVAFFNQGDYISLITSSILESMIIGAFLAIIILAWFLKDVKPTIVVAISIPLSVLLAIVCLYFTNISLNIMSLAGLALGVGMLVDNSIVVIENIYRLKTLGMPANKAAVVGAKQVAAPIISSTLTTICVFLPMIFTTGLVKEMLIPMAASVVFCLVASLLVALTVVPAAGSTLLKSSTEKPHEKFDKLMDRYGQSLNWCLDHKKIPMAVTVGLLAAAILIIVKMGIVMIPDMYAEPLAITVIVDEEKTRAEAYEIADQVLTAVSSVDGVETASAMTSESMLSMFNSSASGSTSAYNSYLCYVLLEGDNPSEKEIKRMVKEIKDVTADIDCEISISANEMDVSMLTGSGLSIYVYGQNIEKVTDITEDLMDIIAKVDGYEDISNGLEEGDDVVHVYIDKNKAMSYGLSVAQVYADLSGRISDTVKSTTITIDGIDMEIEIQDATKPITKENVLTYSFDIYGQDSDGNTTVKTYFLKDFAEIKEEKTLATLERTNNSRYMTVSATVREGENATLLARELKPLIEEYDAPVGYRVELSGESESIENMVVQMSKLIALGFLFIYLVMVAQFQSLLSPFIVLFTIPLAFTGGMAGLIIMGEKLSIMSLMGFTILMGTVVNNGIVFVDYVNQLRIEGMDRREALVETGKARMRPILMTALTTILAMSKLVISQDIGSQMGGGMAVVIMGGLAYATFMTLYIIPMIYDMFFKKQPLSVNIETE